MLAPAASVAGSVPAFTANMVLDVLKSAICTAFVPEFEIDTVRYTGVPTFTSPKSIVDGFSTRTGVLIEENGFVSEPQPESPRVSPIAATARVTMNPALHGLEWFLLSEASG
jgi:hypothetical protein